MPRKMNTRARVGSAPDWTDIKAAIDAIYDEFRANAEIHIYAALDGNLFVECICDAAAVGGTLAHYTCGRFVHANTGGITTVLLQTIHNVYHQLDREELRLMYARKGAV